MKTIIILIIVIVAGLIFYTTMDKGQSLTPNTDIDTALSTDIMGTYKIEIGSSTASWTGSKKIIANYYDKGNISIKSGEVTLDKGVIIGGTVTFDMNSISAISTGRNSGETNLTTHLKSADFFEAEKYPEATFVVTKVEASSSTPSTTLVGNLTMKGVTAPLSIPVQVGMRDGAVVVTGTANVDRTLWNVKYGSEKFFDKLGDNVINNVFTLEFEVVAKK